MTDINEFIIVSNITTFFWWNLSQHCQSKQYDVHTWNFFDLSYEMLVSKKKLQINTTWADLCTFLYL